MLLKWIGILVLGVAAVRIVIAMVQRTIGPILASWVGFLAALPLFIAFVVGMFTCDIKDPHYSWGGRHSIPVTKECKNGWIFGEWAILHVMMLVSGLYLFSCVREEEGAR